MEADAPTSTPSPGQLLGAERERQGLSRVEMAQRLHMSPSQIEALETGEYSRLPKGPFLRGFVRNYAKALGLDADAVLASLAQDRPTESAPRIVVPSQNIRFDPLGDRLQNPYVKAAGLAAVAIALGFAAMYWWLFIRPTPPATHKPATESPASPRPAAPTQPSVTPPASSAPASSAPSAFPSSPAAPPSTAQNSAAKPEAAAPKADERKTEPAKPDAKAAAPAKVDAKAAAPAKPEASAAAPAKGEGLLQFRFKDESWVEVRDASDHVVFQRLNPADSEASVTGRLPLRVIIGNAGGVSMRFNGRDFALEPHTKVAVARFTLE